ncbi:Alpha/Beta hydrolase protein [Talaromyces proteolyticus]|uniref:Alpha/Beta hydrolase protein n=1 Tax=Talaromyces proteolyticus TaxID=1131652 RepID=A0AAD4KTL8_9EURO|nr:Alpha/Beta hydrolase protein [Talaromyces proteolyticus]KAH8695645.1 Alpha/Beta hydrolase protein [Talaromyces proteolyticus]
MVSQGTFVDVIGLNYRCGTIEGCIGADSVFEYEEQSKIIFSIGPLIIGEARSKPLITVAELGPPDTSIFDARRINRARLLYSLTSGQGFERPIHVDNHVRSIVTKHAALIDLDSPNTSDLDKAITEICTELGYFPKSVSHTRNHLRREAAGFKVMRDMRIPVEDGNYVLADVYLPLELREKYPVLVSCTLYGKRVLFGGPDLENQDEIYAFEKAEDDWHSTSPGVPIQVPHGDSWLGAWTTQRGFENIATFNTYSYVPHGFAMVKVDPRGVSQTPGVRGVPGEITGDLYNAVEWAAEQSWSNGDVALVGSSQGANVQWAVASLKPKGLRCFVPYATDLDMYREGSFIGGIPSYRFVANWVERIRKPSYKWTDHMDILDIMKSNPFDNGLWRAASAQLDSIDLPCLLAAPQLLLLHSRGPFEAWRARNPDNTHLQVVDRDYYSWASREAAGKVLQFLNRYLKGAENPKPERVGIQMRLGYGSWYWRKENNWPVPGTQYTKWYLGSDGFLLKSAPKQAERQFSYSTRTTENQKSGVSFYSVAFKEDVEFAGHFTAVLHMSSSTEDADVVVTLWAVDENGAVVPHSSDGQPEPIAKGFLRVSHRITDPAKTLPERPWHSHTKEDNLLLKPGEVVRIEVEIFPAAARVRRGWKLRLDVTPTEEQPDIAGYKPLDMRVWYSETHPEGQNYIHVGEQYDNYIACPVVPVTEGYPNHVL